MAKALHKVRCREAALQETFEKEALLEQLLRRPSPSDWQAGSRNAVQLAKARRIPQSAVALYLLDLYKLTMPVDTKATSFTDQMMQLVKHVRFVALRSQPLQALRRSKQHTRTLSCICNLRFTPQHLTTACAPICILPPHSVSSHQTRHPSSARPAV